MEDIGTPWRMAYDASVKRPYYYNKDTRETVWEKPPALIAYERARQGGKGPAKAFSTPSTDNLLRDRMHSVVSQSAAPAAIPTHNRHLTSTSIASSSTPSSSAETATGTGRNHAGSEAFAHRVEIESKNTTLHNDTFLLPSTRIRAASGAVPGDVWTEVMDDSTAKVMFYHNETTGESRWILPASEWKPAVQAVKPVAIDDKQRESLTADEPPLNMLGSMISETGSRSNNAKLAEEQEAEVDDYRWAVRLHFDSGSIFFEDLNLGMSIWDDPFVVASTAAAVNLPAEEFDKDELKDLIGYNEAPPHSNFATEESKYCIERIQHWIDSDGVKIPHEILENRIAFPTYPLKLIPEKYDVPKTFQVQVFARSLIKKGESTVKIAFNKESTVADVISTSLKRLQSMDSTVDTSAKCILKITGYQDYLIDPNKPICAYENVLRALRGFNIDTSIVKLTIIVLNEENYAQVMRRVEYDNDNPNEMITGDELIFDFDNFQSPLDLIAQPRQNYDSWKLSSFVFRSEIPSEVKFRVKILRVTNIDLPDDINYLFVKVSMFYCDEPLRDQNGEIGFSTAYPKAPFRNDEDADAASPVLVTAKEDTKFQPVWLTSAIPVQNLPLGTRLCFQLMGVEDKIEKAVPLSYVCHHAFDHRHRLVSGKVTLKMFPWTKGSSKHEKKENPGVAFLSSGPIAQNISSSAAVLQVEFDTYCVPVYGQQIQLSQMLEENETKGMESSVSLTRGLVSSPSENDKEALRLVLNTESSSRVSMISRIGAKYRDIPNEREKEALKEMLSSDPVPGSSMLLRLASKYRDFVCKNIENFHKDALSRILLSTNWAVPSDVRAAYAILLQWAPISPTRAMKLLDTKFGDPLIRLFAIQSIATMPDEILCDFLLQLVQAVKTEIYHDSPLARFLLKRAIANPPRIGHALFWLMHSEMHNEHVCERYGTLLELYLKNCGSHRKSLMKQYRVNHLLKNITERCRREKEKSQRTPLARNLLQKIVTQLPVSYELCLSSRLVCSGIKVEECKVMDSKMAPLWISFDNLDPDGEKIPVIFKAGDDLRQDQMTLQMIRIMDQIWMESGLDLRLRPYACTGTGYEVGMIEIVKDADTTARIMGKSYGVRGAFALSPIDDWLREEKKYSYSQCVDNFIRSCAGYCVATYLMGVGDRHPSNIMVTRAGELFHIDFGHFLGNFKTKLGMKRERAPFVFTPQMLQVMGGTNNEKFLRFLHYCCEGFNMLRKHGTLFIVLFQLMIPAGMPELRSNSDIDYLSQMLQLELTNEDADAVFQKEVYNSLNTASRQVDNFIHILAHQ